jgi:hypothetical protein
MEFVVDSVSLMQVFLTPVIHTHSVSTTNQHQEEKQTNQEKVKQ